VARGQRGLREESRFTVLRYLASISLVGCTSYAQPAEPPRWTHEACARVRVIDERGAPIAGTRVHAQVAMRSCGPSMLPEGCSYGSEGGAVVTTDASGLATACYRASDRTRGATLVAEHAAWPRARVVWSAPATITLGPPRSATIELPEACAGATVIAESAMADQVRAETRGRLATLVNLGPFHYWVRTGSAPKACPSFVRALDARDATTVITLDRSDAVIERPDFAHATATITAFHTTEPLATATLDATGRAVLPLAATSGSTFCLRLTTPTSCTTTFARAGEITRPKMYEDRLDSIAAACGVCP